MREFFDKSAEIAQVSKKQPKPITFRPKTEKQRVSIIKAAGDMRLGEFARLCVMEKIGRDAGKMIIKDQEAIVRVLSRLGRSEIGISLKAISQEAKAGSLLLDEETERKINEAYVCIMQMRSDRIKALGLIESH